MKLRLPQALLAAILIASAQVNAVTVTNGAEQQGSFAANAGTSANGITYTVNGDTGTITAGLGAGDHVATVKFDLDLVAVNQLYSADGLQGYKKLVIINRSGTSTWWGYGITDTGTAANGITSGHVDVRGHWSSHGGAWNDSGNKKYDITNKLDLSNSGNDTLGTLQLTAVLSPDTVAATTGANLTTPEGTDMRMSGLRSSANGANVGNIQLSSNLIKTVYYSYNAQVVTSADSAWTKTYSTYWKITAANTALPTDNTLSSPLGGVLVTAGSLNVAAGEGLTKLTASGADIVVGGTGQMVVTAPAEGITVANNIVLGASTHANANSQGALYFNNTDGTINVNGPIALIEDSTVGAAGHANAVTISGAVTGAHNLSIVSGGNINFTGEVDIASLNLSLAGHNLYADNYALVGHSGSEAFNIAGAITLSNYDGLVAGSYDLMDLGDATLATTIGAKLDIAGMTSTHNRLFSYNTTDSGKVQLVITDQDIVVSSTPANAWDVWNDRHMTGTVTVTGSGTTLNIGSGGQHADYANQTFKYGDQVIIEDGATLNIWSWTSKKVDILTDNKPIISSNILLKQGGTLKTDDGSYYFSGGITVDGSATVINNRDKGIVYSAINAGEHATTDTVLKFTQAAGYGSADAYIGAVTFGAAGNFAGTVTLENPKKTTFILNHSQALQNANVNMSEQSSGGALQLRLNVATATFAGLNGNGTLMLNGNNYGATNAPTASTLTITGHATGAKEFSGTIGTGVSVVTTDAAQQTFSNMTLQSGATLTLGAASSLSGTLALDVTSGLANNTAMITSTGSLGTMGAVTLTGTGAVTADTNYTLMSLKTAADAKAVVAGYSKPTSLTSFINPILAADGTAVKLQATNVIAPSTTVTLDGGELVVSNNSAAYAGAYDSTTKAAELTFSEDTTLNLSSAQNSEKTFTAQKAENSDPVTVTIDTLTLGASSGKLTIQGSDGASVQYTRTATDAFLIRTNSSLTLGKNTSFTYSGTLDIGGGKTLELNDNASVSVQKVLLGGGSSQTGILNLNGTSTFTIEDSANNSGDSAASNSVSLLIGHWNGNAIGKINIDGGTLSAAGSVMYMQLDGTGYFTMSSGEATVKGIHFGARTATDIRGKLTLTGGNLHIGEFGIYGIGNGDANAEKSFNWGAATITADADWTTRVANATGNNADGSIHITATGSDTATLDTQEFNVTINHAIDGAGNLTKTGTGTLTLNEGAAANVTLNEGTLVVGDGKSLTSLNATGTVGGAFTTGSLTSTTSLALQTGAAITIGENGSISLGGVLDLTTYVPSTDTMAFTLGTGATATIADGFIVDLSTSAANVTTAGTGIESTGKLGSSIVWNIGAGLGLEKTNFRVDKTLLTTDDTTYTWSNTDGTLSVESYVYNIAASDTATATAGFATGCTGVLFQDGATLNGVTDATTSGLTFNSAVSQPAEGDSVTASGHIAVGAGEFTMNATNLGNFKGDITVGTGSTLVAGPDTTIGAMPNVTGILFNGGTLSYGENANADISSLLTESTTSDKVKVNVGSNEVTWENYSTIRRLVVDGNDDGKLILGRTSRTNNNTLDELVINSGTVSLAHGKALKGAGGENANTIGTAITMNGGTLELQAPSVTTGLYDNTALGKTVFHLGETLTLSPDEGNEIQIVAAGNYGLGLNNNSALTYDGSKGGGTATISADIGGFGTSGVKTVTFQIGDSANTNLELDVQGYIGNATSTNNVDSHRTTLKKTGAGTMRIGNTNYLPKLEIVEGTIIAAHADALGKTTDTGTNPSTDCVQTVTVGTGDTTGSATLDIQADVSTAILAGNDKGVITNTSATAKTLTVGASGVAASTFGGKVTSNVNLEVAGSTATFNGDLSEFNGDVTVTGGNLNIANSKADTTLNIGTLTLASGAGTTTLGGDSTANTIKIANGKTLTIEADATLTHDGFKYTGGTGNGSISKTSDSNTDTSQTDTELFSLFYAAGSTVSNVKMEKTGTDAKTIKTQMTNVEFVNEKGGVVEFTHADNNFTSLNSIAEVKLSGDATRVQGDSSVAKLTGTRSGIALSIDEDATLTTADLGNAEHILNGLGGDGTLEYTGTGVEGRLTLGRTTELGTVNGNFHATNAALEFHNSYELSNALTVAGTMTTEKNIELVSKANVTVEGELSGKGQLIFAHNQVNSDTFNGTVTVKDGGKLTAEGGAQFRGATSTLNIEGGEVTLGNTGTKTTVTAGGGYGVSANRGTINLADAAKINIINADISHIDFVTAAGRSEIDITAGAETAKSCVGAAIDGNVPASTTALMEDCSLKNTDVVMSVAAGAATESLNDRPFGSEFTLKVLSGVTMLDSTLSLDLTGLENYTNVQLHWSMTPLAEATPTLLMTTGDAAGGTINLDTTALTSMDYTGGPVVFESTNGQVVDVWVSYNVPEPTTGALSMLALAALAARRRRKSDK